jgi:hypothetical protein
MLDGEARQQFEELHAAGMTAKDDDDHAGALMNFEQADELALANDDNRKRLDALQPGARALWSLGRFNEAGQKLETAAKIAQDLELIDEQAIIISNIGRLATVKTIRTIPIKQQAAVLKAEAVPKFDVASSLLKSHPHLYYRYANAQHGSVVAALANERIVAARLIKEGLSVAFRKSPEPYDQQRTYEINRDGLKEFLAATALLLFGDRTPVIAKRIRSGLAR